MRAPFLVCLVALSGCTPFYELQARYLFQPDGVAGDEVQEPAGLERWSLPIQGGQVEAWFLPADPPRAGSGPAVVFAHGNRERIEPWGPRLRPYREMGLAVLLPEYRGYGRSGGEPSEEAIVADFARFYDRLVERPDIDGARVVFHGRSLGGGVVGVLSGRRRCAALVLESTFTNVPDLASQWMAPAAAIRDRFDTREVLLGSVTPTLILHGVRDTVVPIRHAVELDRVAWDSRLVAFEAEHDVPHDQTYWRRVREFLVQAGVLPDA